MRGAEPRLERALDHQLIAACKPALEKAEKVALDLPIRNVNRTVGAMLSGEVARRYGDTRSAGRHDPRRALTGTAGQTFGAFLARGVTFELEGQANDYVGKGLSGGRLIIYPPTASKLAARQEHHRRQHRPLRRDRRRMLFQRRRRRAFRRA